MMNRPGVVVGSDSLSRRRDAHEAPLPTATTAPPARTHSSSVSSAALPATDVVAGLYESVCAAGDDQADHSVLMAHVARLAGLEWRAAGG